MLGVMRFVLALMVLLSHGNGTGFRVNLGVVAVIIFYFTSGYLMQRSYGRFVIYSKSPIRDFYVDRVLKLFPQYGLMVVVSFAAIALFGPAQHVPFLNQEPKFDKVLLNLALLPTNYVFSPLVIESLLPHPIVPPAWSLATEFHFYLMLPLIYLLPRKAFLAVLGLTVGVQVGALFFHGANFNSANFGYRFIFGVLTFFLFGYAHAKSEEHFYRQVTRAVWVGYVCLLVFFAPAFGLFSAPLAMELILGASLALPLVSSALKSKPQKAWLIRADYRLGRLAFPIFISHFFSFYVAEKLFGLTSNEQDLYLPSTISICLCVSYGLMRIQDGFEAYRLRRRGFSSLVADAKSSGTRVAEYQSAI